LSGPQYHKQIESYTPYDLWGDCGVWTPPLGYYTLTATPYPLHWGYGQAGASLTIHFTVTK
jgi:hypothetical protein